MKYFDPHACQRYEIGVWNCSVETKASLMYSVYIYVTMVGSASGVKSAIQRLVIIIIILIWTVAISTVTLYNLNSEKNTGWLQRHIDKFDHLYSSETLPGAFKTEITNRI